MTLLEYCAYDLRLRPVQQQFSRMVNDNGGGIEVLVHPNTLALRGELDFNDFNFTINQLRERRIKFDAGLIKIFKKNSTVPLVVFDRRIGVDVVSNPPQNTRVFYIATELDNPTPRNFTGWIGSSTDIEWAMLMRTFKDSGVTMAAIGGAYLTTPKTELNPEIIQSYNEIVSRGKLNTGFIRCVGGVYRRFLENHITPSLLLPSFPMMSNNLDS